MKILNTVKVFENYSHSTFTRFLLKFYSTGMIKSCSVKLISMTSYLLAIGYWLILACKKALADALRQRLEM
jgi:hypothetical protein